ncbi:3-deoxy-D-manno-octulosonic acid transferase [Roseovarius salinarum]|uniref:3-deoxy-D-manno-octulosonic acid transferase n=1 Tax=Roseovarius salinarum TaxID=1981892 RepID=UPI000C3456AF|nr:glycosyltransferase N-terminal domain-containing protein [Roseovarius salinarum]
MRSLSLAAYLALARRTPEAEAPSAPQRPDGEVIWANAADATRAEALVQLADRLAAQRPGLHMLLTGPDDGPAPRPERPHVIVHPLPEDRVGAAEGFLDHWRPDVCLWTAGAFRPALLTMAYRRGIPLFLLDAEASALDHPQWRWFPDLPRAVVRCFDRILARGEGAAQALRRLGARPARIDVAGPFLEGGITLPCNDEDHQEMLAVLAGRPVWLAAKLQPDELDMVLRAHRTANRLAHRLLLVVVPDEAERADAFRARLAGDGWRWASWPDGETPGETTQVVLADDRAAMGLWYRIATVTFMGSSLVAGRAGRDPNEPAAHGTAILHGPNVGGFRDSYERYAAAGAARMVRDTDALAVAVEELIAPDRAAEMAHAAWDVASQGAEVMDLVAELMHETLDERAVG